MGVRIGVLDCSIGGQNIKKNLACQQTLQGALAAGPVPQGEPSTRRLNFSLILHNIFRGTIELVIIRVLRRCFQDVIFKNGEFSGILESFERRTSTKLSGLFANLSGQTYASVRRWKIAEIS